VTRATRTVAWQPILDEAASAKAIAVAHEVTRRVGTLERVHRAIELARLQTVFPKSVHWRPFAVAQGFAGLAILCGGVDDVFPRDGWERRAHEYLSLAARGAEAQPRLQCGLYSGLAGLAFAAWYLSRGGARYRRLLATLDAALFQQLARATAHDTVRHGVDVTTFDVISGLAGMGRYLLLRAHEPAHCAALKAVLRTLVTLLEEESGLPHWHTPARFLADSATQAKYPDGNLNCGLAHGIPGPLALLSLAATEGVVVEGQHDAIDRAAGWLRDQQIHDRWGVNWPIAVPLIDGPRDNAPSRTAWCYGAPGVARALWFAGEALHDASCRELAVAAMEAVYRRPLPARRIDSPTFCHGVAGLQQITLRFANEFGGTLFVDAARALHQQLIDAYEPESLLGYRNVEPGGGRVDQVGFLDGAGAVPLVLLAASTPVEPRWDALFLLS
jgi:lantibiotic biosynthesis protein